MGAAIGEDSSGSGASLNQPLAYSDLEKLQVLCLVQESGRLGDAALREEICRTIAQNAKQGSPVPVEVVSTGDPKIVQPGRLTILAHVAIAEVGGTNQLVFAMRPYRPAVAGSDILFGAMPRTASTTDKGQIERAIASALDEILPWRAARPVPQAID